MSPTVLYAGSGRPPESVTAAFSPLVTADGGDAVREALAGFDVDGVVLEREVGEDAAMVRAVRAVDESVPVVCVSATLDPSYAVTVTDAGADDYHPLDASTESLAERVAGHLPGEVGIPETAVGADADTAAGEDADGERRSPGAGEVPGGRTAMTDGTGVAGDASLQPLGADRTAFEAIAGSTSDAFITIDADSTVVYANDGLEAVTGYTPAEAVGTDFTGLMPERFRGDHVTAVESYLETGQRNLDWSYIELPVQHKAGHEVETAASFGEFEHDGETYFTGIIRDVSDKRAYERELEATNDRLAHALQSTTAGVFQWDYYEGEIHLEPLAAELFGLDATAVDWTTETFMEQVHPEDRERVATAGDAVHETGEFDVTFRVERDGETRWLQSEGQLDDEGAVVGIVQDVTEAERAEREQSRNQRALRNLQELAADASKDIDERLDRALEIGRERLGLPVAYLNELDGDRLTVSQVDGEFPGVTPGRSMPLPLAYCRDTVSTPGLTALPDVSDSEFAGEPTVEESGMYCYLGAEVTVDGETYGTLCFGGGEPREEPFSDAEETFIELLTEWVSHELERYGQRRRLAAAQQRTEQVFDRIDDAFFALDTDWEFTYFNGRAESVLGVSAEQVLGENVWEVFDEALGSEFEREYRTAMETQEATSFESYFEPFDQWFSVSAYPSPDGLSVYFTDVTERKRYQQAVSQLHDTTRSLMAAGERTLVTDIAAAAAEDVLGFDAGFRLYDAETDTLELASVSDRVAERMDVSELPTYRPGEGGPGLAFSRREPVVRTGSEVERDCYGATMYVPVGGLGTLSLGAESADAFTEYSEPLAELLADNVAAALDRVQREDRLRRYETVLESVQDMVYVADADGEFTYVTEPLAAWLGCDRSTLYGRALSEIVVDDTDVEAAVDELRETDADSVSVETTLRLIGGEDRPATVELSLYPGTEFAGTVGVVRDRTDLLRTREELRTERDRFSYLFDNLPDSVVDVGFEDDSPVVHSVNDAFEEVFGYSEASLVGEDLDEYIVPEDERGDDLPAEYREDGERLTDQDDEEGFTGEVTRVTDSGPATFLFRGVPYTTADGTTHGLGIYTDITEQKRRERRLAVLNRVLRHNLRNELSVIVGHTGHLRDQLDGEAAATAERVLEKAEEVADLADRAREIERAAGSNDRRETDVAALVERALAGLEGSAAVETDVPAGLTALADDRLTLVVRHLVENALEHGGEDPQVRVSAERDADGFALRVADDGPGIPDAEWDVVAGNDDLTQLSHASGLGLWLTRWVVESYGGRFERREGPLGGTEIELRLD